MNDTATLDNGEYTCQITITVSGRDIFTETSDPMHVILLGKYSNNTIYVRICIYTCICMQVCACTRPNKYLNFQLKYITLSDYT